MGIEVEVEVDALVWAGLAVVRERRMGRSRVCICMLGMNNFESGWF